MQAVRVVARPPPGVCVDDARARHDDRTHEERRSARCRVQHAPAPFEPRWADRTTLYGAYSAAGIRKPAMRACGTTTACCSHPLCALVLDWTACCMLSEPVDLTDPIQSVLHCTLERSTANRTTRCGKGKAHTASPPELSPASVTRAASPPKTPTRARSHCSATMTSLSPADVEEGWHRPAQERNRYLILIIPYP